MEPKENPTTHNEGVNFNLRNQWQPEKDAWEKQQGVSINAEGHFKDWDSHNAKEHDIKGHIDVVGMPVANCNYNTHDDNY